MSAELDECSESGNAGDSGMRCVIEEVSADVTRRNSSCSTCIVF